MNKVFTQEQGDWAEDAVFYHIYPLGLLGAAGIDSPAQARAWRVRAVSPERTLADLIPWVDHCKALGCTALYLGPVFQSTSHGYDTIDYTRVDDRLGSNGDLVELVGHCHRNGVKVILDGVFNHAGREFFAFRDLQEHGEQSMFKDWFKDIDFSKRSPRGDSFSYEGWNGHYDLVKFNLAWDWTRDHLLDAVEGWIDEFDIDGIRLDAADCLSQDFISALSGRCKSIKPDFWLMGEVVHGDYRQWARQGGLDSVTNYEAYKGLHSSFNEGNFFEIAHTLRRQFAPGGIYPHLRLYQFADNHDVNRIGSVLARPEFLEPLHTLLFTMPGIPSLYYGSEWASKGTRLPASDRTLRPSFPEPLENGMLAGHIQALARLRQKHPVLIHGEYHQVFVSHKLFCFARVGKEETALVLVNSDERATVCKILGAPGWMRDGSSFDQSMLGQSRTFEDPLQGLGPLPFSLDRLDVEIEAFGTRVLIIGN